MKNVKDDYDRYDDDRANDPKLMTEAQLRAGMLFPGCREEYEAELRSRAQKRSKWKYQGSRKRSDEP